MEPGNSTVRSLRTPGGMAEIQDADNGKHWRRRGATTEILICRWKEHKGRAVLEDGLVIFHKTKPWHAERCRNHTPGVYPEETVVSTQNWHADVYSGFLHNFQNLNTTKMSCSRQWCIQELEYYSAPRGSEESGHQRCQGAPKACS